MFTRDYGDILGGGLLFGIGAAVAWHALMHYPLGSVNRMGPGMFPMGLGVILAVLGLGIAVAALFRHGVMPALDVRPAAAVLAGVAAFALIIERFGLVPAITLQLLITTRGDSKLGYGRMLALLVGLNALSVLIFRIGLSMPVRIFDWPF